MTSETKNPMTTATAGTGSPGRRRGIIQLHEEILDRILDLPEGQRIIGFHSDMQRLSINVCVEGEGLPACAPGSDAMVVNSEPYTARFSRWAMRGRELEEMIEAVADNWSKSDDPDNAKAAAMFRSILDGSYDPRTES